MTAPVMNFGHVFSTNNMFQVISGTNMKYEGNKNRELNSMFSFALYPTE